MLQEYLSTVCQGDGLVAIHKNGAEFILQTFDLGRDGRLGQVQKFSALRKLIVLEMVISVSNWLMFIGDLLAGKVS